MLQTLKIENVALIDSVTLEFNDKLNVISGETGAGKSILLDSLSFVFGSRADKTLIREGVPSMRVEAIFTGVNSSHVEYIKNECNIDCSDELFISRTLDEVGKNVCKINGELVPVAVLKKVCSRIIDIHGQSEHLALLNNDYQLEIIDLFSCKAEEIKEGLRSEIEEYKNIENEIKALGGSEKEKQNLIDLYSFQIAEIESLNLKENEYEDLLLEKREMQEAEKISASLSAAHDLMTKSNLGESSLEVVNSAERLLRSIAEFNPKYSAINERLKSAYLELSDISESLKDFLDSNVFDEARFNYVDERLDSIKSAYRKYGGSYASLMKYHDEISTKLNNLKNSEELRQDLLSKQEKVLQKIDETQKNLSEVRKQSAAKLSCLIQAELENLGMKNARLEVEFSRIPEQFSLLGLDRVEFMFSSNLGFQLKPLAKVVSGGEMSRVMLAYKIVVGEIDSNETIIFDEVDTGLSGQIALAVAQYLARLSRKKQVIAVSHLPQICAMADCNIKVEKYSTNSTTKTNAKLLSDSEVYLEIARLMGAENSIGQKASVELKTQSTSFKSTLTINE